MTIEKSIARFYKYQNKKYATLLSSILETDPAVEGELGYVFIKEVNEMDFRELALLSDVMIHVALGFTEGAGPKGERSEKQTDIDNFMRMSAAGKLVEQIMRFRFPVAANEFLGEV